MLQLWLYYLFISFKGYCGQTTANIEQVFFIYTSKPAEVVSLWSLIKDQKQVSIPDLLVFMELTSEYRCDNYEVWSASHVNTEQIILVLIAGCDQVRTVFKVTGVLCILLGRVLWRNKTLYLGPYATGSHWRLISNERKCSFWRILVMTHAKSVI